VVGRLLYKISLGNAEPVGGLLSTCRFGVGVCGVGGWVGGWQAINCVCLLCVALVWGVCGCLDGGWWVGGRARLALLCPVRPAPIEVFLARPVCL